MRLRWIIFFEWVCVLLDVERVASRRIRIGGVLCDFAGFIFEWVCVPLDVERVRSRRIMLVDVLCGLTGLLSGYGSYCLLSESLVVG